MSSIIDYAVKVIANPEMGTKSLVIWRDDVALYAVNQSLEPDVIIVHKMGDKPGGWEKRWAEDGYTGSKSFLDLD